METNGDALSCSARDARGGGDECQEHLGEGNQIIIAPNGVAIATEPDIDARLRQRCDRSTLEKGRMYMVSPFAQNTG